MKKNVLISVIRIISFILLLSYYSSAQIRFQRWYEHLGADEGISCLQTNDVGYAVLCFTGGSSIYFNTLLKMDSIGNILWSKKFPNSYRAITFCQVMDGGFIIGGNFNGGGYLIKINSNGNALWTKLYDGAAYSVALTIRSLKETLDHGLIITGSTDSLSNNGAYRLMKTDSAGNLQWMKDFGPPYHKYSSYDVEICYNEGYIITGHFLDTAATLIRTDNFGNVIWAKIFGVSTDLYTRGYGVVQSPDSGFVVFGYDFDGRNKIFLLKVTNSGGVEWAKKIWINEWSIANSISKTADGGFIICAGGRDSANTNQDAYIIKFDMSGNILWSKTYGSNLDEDGLYISQVMDGGYIISGFTTGFSTVTKNVYLVKTDGNGDSDCYDNYVNSKEVNLTSVITVGPLNGIRIWPTDVTDTALTLIDYNVIDYVICNSVGTDELFDEKNTLSLSPNPASSELFLSISSNLKPKTTLSIYNFLGAEILTVPITNSQTNINIRSLPAGVYFINVKEGGKNLGGKKFVKI